MDKHRKLRPGSRSLQVLSVEAWLFHFEVAPYLNGEHPFERCAKSRLLIVSLLETLKNADDLSRRLQASGRSLPTTTTEEKQLLQLLDRANEILGKHRGVLGLYCGDNYELLEGFAYDRKRRERDDLFDSQARTIQTVFSLFRRGSIHRVHLCRECKKWFFALKNARKTFCGSNCRQRFASHSDDFRLRRRVYMCEYRRQENERNEQVQSLARRKR